MNSQLIKTSFRWTFLALFFVMFLNSCQTSEDDVKAVSPIISEAPVSNAGPIFKAPAEHGLINCGFDNVNDVLAGNPYGFELSIGSPYPGYASHSSYKIEGSWFKSYINKTYNNPDDNTNAYRGRAEVFANNLISAPAGKVAYIKMIYFAPQVCSFNTSKTNQMGSIEQLITAGGVWRPLFLLMGGDNLTMAIYPTLTTSTVLTVKTGNQRGVMHTIEIWCKMSRGTDGYYDVKYDGDAKKRLYTGRTLPDNTEYPIAFKAGTYSMGPYAYYSEVWLHSTYVSW